jgi:arylsulfatase A-like enzyme
LGGKIRPDNWFSFLLRWPGHTRAGRYNDLIITVDLAFAILRAAGVKVPARMQGLNLLYVAGGKGRLKRTVIFGEIYTHTASNIHQPNLDVTHRWAREGDWKLIQHLREKKAELFNLADDPYECIDLASRGNEFANCKGPSNNGWLEGRRKKAEGQRIELRRGLLAAKKPFFQPFPLTRSSPVAHP